MKSVSSYNTFKSRHDLNIVLVAILSFFVLEATIAQSKGAYETCKIESVEFRCKKNISYGSHSLQKYDLYLPNKNLYSKPPLVIYIHGGGYYTGDKSSGIESKVPAKKYLDAGMAWATINYRLSGEFPFRKSKTMPYPVQMEDSARALQKLRSTAKYHGYSKDKIALSGISAGGGISLWIALHDDLGDSSSASHHLKQSTKVPCVALADTQTTLNIPEIAELMEGTSYALDVGLSGLYGLTPEQYAKAPKRWDSILRESYLEASPISHLSADDRIKIVIVHAMGFATGDIHGAEFGAYLSEGEPLSLANDYNRNSLAQFNIPNKVYNNVASKNKARNLIFNYLKSCLAEVQ